MLAKQYRLTGQTNLSDAKIYTSPFLIIKASANTLSYSRFGFIVSKKVAMNAVERNRLKRAVRAVIEQNREKIKKGYDMLFILRKYALGRENNILQSGTLNMLEKNSLL